MPLIIFCGYPCSGKTTRTLKLCDYFKNEHNKHVDIISEESAIQKLGYDKNEFYLDSQKEKRVRGLLKSEVLRLMGKDNLVILDGGNYIKGFRYELYCASKSCKSTQCTIYPVINVDEAWNYNVMRTDTVTDDQQNPILTSKPYTRNVFDALVMRFEEPLSSNRWDSPLFGVQSTDELNMLDIYKALYEMKPPPPNMSTQNPPLSSTNFLYELDKVTQAISNIILDSKRMNQCDTINFPEYPNCSIEVGALECVNSQRLLRLRRQFLTYAKMQHSGEDATKIGRYFIQYLNKSLNDD